MNQPEETPSLDDVRASLSRGDLVEHVRRLLGAGAADHGAWLRENVRHALATRRENAVAISALTGLAPGTVRGFLNGRPSSIDNVLLIAEAIGYTLAELDRPPDEFRQRVATSPDATDGEAIGASLLAFEDSPTAMAIVRLDGTIVKVNGKLRELLGYDDGELVGAPAATFSISSEEDRAERRDELTATDATHARVSKLRRKDGTIVSAVTSALVVRDDEGQPRYVIARAGPVSQASS